MNGGEQRFRFRHQAQFVLEIQGHTDEHRGFFVFDPLGTLTGTATIRTTFAVALATRITPY